MPTNKENFERWLDGQEINEAEKVNWEDAEDLQDDYEMSLWLRRQAADFVDQPVPQWDRESTFEATKQRHRSAIWTWFSAPSLSMAISLVAIFMVLFKVQVSFGEQGLLISFAGDERQQVERLMDEKLKNFGRDQQLIMANYVDDIQAQQKQDITQLASYLVESNRQERKEAISDVVNYINRQRADDFQIQQQKLQQVTYRITQDSARSLYRPSSLTSDAER